MQFEAIKPAHRGLAPCRDVLEHLVRRNAVIVTRRARRRVKEGNPRAGSFSFLGRYR
jgi:hypothetical protein